MKNTLAIRHSWVVYIDLQGAGALEEFTWNGYFFLSSEFLEVV